MALWPSRTNLKRRRASVRVHVTVNALPALGFAPHFPGGVAIARFATVPVAERVINSLVHLEE